MRSLFLIALLLAGCTAKNSLEYGLDLKDTIRINLQVEPPTLDWTMAHDTTSGHIIKNIMQGLIDYDLNDPQLTAIGALATEWTASPDARIWTFTLRKGVKWTDGVEFSAQQVLDAWERMLNPKSRCQYGYFFFPVKNGEAYFRGKVKDFSQVGFKINDKGQIIVELDHPMVFFPKLLAHSATFPIRKDLIEKYGEDKWTDPAHMVSLGPYKLKIWDHDKAIVLERNDSFWGPKAKTKNVLGYMILEYSTAVSLFRADRLDFQENLPWTDVSQLKSLPGFRETPLLGFYFYAFNTRKPPFDNVKVRKAFANAIDRKQITDLLSAGLVAQGGWLPKGLFGYQPDIGIKFDVARANQLLDEAGFKDRSKFPKFSIGFNTDENHQRVAENIQAQLKKNLGVVAELQNEEWKVYLAHLKSDAPAIYRLGWITDYPDPDAFMKIMLSTAENNYTGWKNKTYDDLVNTATAQLSDTQRIETYKKAQIFMVEDEVPVFPIFSIVYPQLISPRLKNFPTNMLNRIDLKGVSIQ